MVKKKANLETVFSVNLLTDTIAIPKMLLTQYHQLDLNEKELVVILKTYTAGIEKGLTFTDFGEERVVIPGLIKKKFVVIKQENQQEHLCLNWCVLFERLLELWVYQQSIGKEPQTQPFYDQKEPADMHFAELEKSDFAKLYQAFESEFGRGLSPLETEKIMDWQENLGFREDVILEALKRAVYRGKFSFAYIDTILHDWYKKNIRTVAEIERMDMDRNMEPAKSQRKPKSKEVSKNKTDYSLVYQKK